MVLVVIVEGGWKPPRRPIRNRSYRVGFKGAIGLGLAVGQARTVLVVVVGGGGPYGTGNAGPRLEGNWADFGSCSVRGLQT